MSKRSKVVDKNVYICYHSLMDKKGLKERFKLQKRTPKQHAFRYSVMVVMCFAVALTYYCFVNGNSFAAGGVYGIGTMFESKLGIPQGLVVFIISIPIVIGAFILLDLDSALTITLMILLTAGFESLMYKLGFFQFIAEDKVTKIFSAVLGGILAGVTYAYSLQIYGVADGTVAISAMVKSRKPHLNIAWLLFIFDFVVVAASFFVFWSDYTKNAAADATLSQKIVLATEPIMYSLVNMFVASKVCDVLLRGLGVAYKFEVITDHPQEISNEIFSKLQRGVTQVPAKGMYTGKEKSMLVCVIKKKQIAEFKKIVKSYPDTFAYLTTTSEIMGYFSK